MHSCLSSKGGSDSLNSHLGTSVSRLTHTLEWSLLSKFLGYFSSTYVSEGLGRLPIMSHVLAACKMPLPKHETSITTVAAVPAHVTSTLANKAEK